MSSKKLEGVFGPVVTPFLPNEGFDVDAFLSNGAAHMDAGLDGLVVAGSTGEAALLEEDERRVLIEIARSVVPADKWLIVGTGAESTRACVRRCRDAADRGADAALVVAPHYYSSAMSPASLSAHYERVADESPIPVLLYNIPKYMHFRLEPSLVARLAEHDNVAGMKDSSGDLVGLTQYMESQGAHFTVLTGHGGTFAQALALGCRGGILAVGLFAPELSREVFDAHNEGRLEHAAEVQSRLTPLAAEIVARMGVPGVKAALDRVGLRGGVPRLPLLPLGDGDAGQLASLLRSASVSLTS